MNQRYNENYIKPDGPWDADIFICGECPGEKELDYDRNFSGPSGRLMDGMLNEVGLLRSDCFVTNVFRYHPFWDDIRVFVDKRQTVGKKNEWKLFNGKWVNPEVFSHIEHLKREIEDVRPNIIIAFGETALWAITGQSGITKWQGSVMESTLVPGVKVVPLLHPAAILRDMSQRHITTAHLRKRVVPNASFPELLDPGYRFKIRPSLQETLDFLRGMPELVSADIETLGRRQISCIGFGTSQKDALCIPFTFHGDRRAGYWNPEEEALIIETLIEEMPKRKIIGQNWAYDFQYIARYWGVPTWVYWDTMLAFNLIFAGLPKGLDFQSSLLCEFHTYWKDERKDWRERDIPDYDKYWEYNCKDCVITYELYEIQSALISQLGLQSQMDFQHRMWKHVSKSMLRGVLYDMRNRDGFAKDLEEHIRKTQADIDYCAAHSLNTGSNKQMKDFFYLDLGFTPIKDRKTKAQTVNDKALETLGNREPLIKPLCNMIRAQRSYRTFKQTFIDAKPEVVLGPDGFTRVYDPDGNEIFRMRSSINVAGTETHRLASSQDPFGSGLNLMNLPKKDKKSIGVPNIRKLFLPDPGYRWISFDLDRADVWIVAYESGDEALKAALAGPDFHAENATDLHVSRDFAKVGAHLTNYAGTARTMAGSMGITVREAEDFQYRYFQKYPKIKEWHEKTWATLEETATVVNPFGYARHYYDRIQRDPTTGYSKVLCEALAWVPQSTVGLVINKGIDRVLTNLEDSHDIQFLLQLHDEANFQLPAIYPLETTIPLIKQNLEYPIDYGSQGILTIPVGCSQSEISWGDVKEWPNES